jgi:hypothetical protein
MLFVTFTWHSTVPPPPLPSPLHWFAEVISCEDRVTTVWQLREVFAAPLHVLTVSTDVARPVATL